MPQETLKQMEMEIDIVSPDTMSRWRWRWTSGLYPTFRPGDFHFDDNYFKVNSNTFLAPSFYLIVQCVVPV